MPPSTLFLNKTLSYNPITSSYNPDSFIQMTYGNNNSGTMSPSSISLSSSFNKSTSKRPQTTDSLKDFASSSTRKKVAKLNAEISKLRAITVFTRAELEEQLSSQREEMFKLLEEEEKKYLTAQKRLHAVRDEIKSKEEYSAYVKRRSESKEEELKYVEEERHDLQRRLDKLCALCNEHKAKAGGVEAEALKLQEKLKTLLAQQETVVSSSLALEKKMEAQASARIDRLRAMLDAEMELKQQSSRLRFMGNKKLLTECMNDQKENVKSIIETLSYDMRDNIEEISSSTTPQLVLLK